MGQVSDVDKYISAWTKTQLEIWREKIERMNIVRSGALHESFKAQIQQAGGGSAISMKFLQYGIFQALGVGYGFAPGNPGDLPFMDPEYRKEHGLDRPRKVGPAWGGGMTSGKPREPRDWFSKKLYMSTMAMLEDMARIYGDNVARVVCDQLTDIHSALT